MTKTVAVLMGGFSAERQVSLSSGAECVKALEKGGYNVRPIDVSRDIAELQAALTPRPDVCFNALHGPYGEDGNIQGLLNFMQIPYTHSGVLASSLAMDKPMAKHLFAAAGIPVAEDLLCTREELMSGIAIELPFVIKPVNEGSSVGVQIIMTRDDMLTFSDNYWPYTGKVMVERFVPGRELTVGVMGDRALPVTEVVTDRAFYDYDAKYEIGGSTHILPAPIDEDLTKEVQRLALLAHQSLGCRGVSRSDFRYDAETGTLFILELNTQPGMTPTSLVPEMAMFAGTDFVELVSWMVENAACDA
ncbi:D-alanine--D-alanine ligase [Alphaproteobacteria bacterium HT1-32]|nr:D-alanine--D-alanine ligase [Alphaproteobacteria bacterium HT1-32]